MTWPTHLWFLTLSSDAAVLTAGNLAIRGYKVTSLVQVGTAAAALCGSSCVSLSAYAVVCN